MPNKLTDTEIKKALKCCIKSSYFGECFENECPLVSEEGCKVGKETLYPYALDLINRKDQENESLKAEVERLKNAYKQCAWERDIFAEDMKEEIKKDCSYLMLDIKTIKAEAYKECIEKVKEHSSKMELVCSGALVRTDYTITKKTLDNLLKEFERKENTTYDD